MGDRECPDCGRAFKNERALKSHRALIDHGRLRKKEEVRKLVESPNSEQHVYVLRIERAADGKEFLYVGMSNSVVVRIMNHLSGPEQGISLPEIDGGMTRQDYDVVGLVETTPYPDRGKAVNAERERALELAIERGHTDIIGGR